MLTSRRDSYIYSIMINPHAVGREQSLVPNPLEIIALNRWSLMPIETPTGMPNLEWGDGGDFIQ